MRGLATETPRQFRLEVRRTSYCRTRETNTPCTYLVSAEKITAVRRRRANNATTTADASSRPTLSLLLS